MVLIHENVMDNLLNNNFLQISIMISVSMLSGYLYCPRKLYLNYVLKVKGVEKSSLIIGKIKHSVIEYVNKMENEIVGKVTPDMLYEDIENLYRQSYYRILMFQMKMYKNSIKELNLNQEEVFSDTWQALLNEAKFRANNVTLFKNKTKLHGQELWLKLTPKYISEMKIISKTLNLVGKIDKVEQYHDFILPCELKSGKAPNSGLWPGHRVQLAAYIMLLKEQFKDVNEGYVHYLDAKEKRRLVLNPAIEDEVKDLINKVGLLLGSNQLPKKTDNENKCANCELKEQCFSMS